MHGELFSWACTYCPGMRTNLWMKSYSVGRGFIFPVEPVLLETRVGSTYVEIPRLVERGLGTGYVFEEVCGRCHLRADKIHTTTLQQTFLIIRTALQSSYHYQTVRLKERAFCFSCSMSIV